MEVIDDLKDTTDEVVDNVANSDEKLPDDKLGKHNVFSRLIIAAVIFVFIYTFMAPLAPAYATISSYVLVIVFLAITFGINSLKIIADILEKWRK